MRPVGCQALALNGLQPQEGFIYVTNSMANETPPGFPCRIHKTSPIISILNRINLIPRIYSTTDKKDDSK